MRKVFEACEEFAPLCLAKLRCEHANLGAHFEVFDAIIRYRPLEVVSTLDSIVELSR